MEPFSDGPPHSQIYRRIQGYWIRILTPEESERMLREEPRIPIEEFMTNSSANTVLISTTDPPAAWTI
jgi:hypothetical protein